MLQWTVHLEVLKLILCKFKKKVEWNCAIIKLIALFIKELLLLLILFKKQKKTVQDWLYFYFK